ncbi:SRPBCC family protein [Akkermansiaceae bacterium]|nr:SRPBCC family protein [Akkermansiaceae bacterium]MDB4286714.1 SRPBCC family protein [bacterium]
MAHLHEKKEIAAAPERLFNAINNYGRRLEWDTLLRAAEVFDENGAKLPLNTPLVEGMIVRSYGRWLSGGVVMDTRYTFCQFPDTKLEMVKGPWFFETFQAWAHLEETSDGGTRWKGQYTYTCRPRLLRFIIEPIVGWIFRTETKLRVKGLKKWLEEEDRAIGKPT